MTADRDLYEVMEVPSNASTEEVHDAYYRAVRRHPPERDPEGFRRVQAAYEILKSPTARREYDDARGADQETARLIEDGRRLLENEDPEATKPLMRAFARRPDSLVVSDLLIKAFMAAGQEPKAARLAKKLIDQEPDSPTHHLRLAQAYRGMNRNDDALGPLKTAVGLAEDDPQPIVELAYLYSELGRADRAVALLNGAIHHDGTVDFGDFIFFQTLCRIHVGEGHLDELDRVHWQISGILPPDRDTRAYVAWFYYRDALAMARVGHYAAGLKTIEEAAAIDDSLPDLHAIKTRLQGLHGVVTQCAALKDDESVNGVVRIAVGAQVFCFLYGENEEAEANLGRAMDVMRREAMIENSEVDGSIGVIRARYPEVAEILEEWLSDLEEIVRETEGVLRRVGCHNCQAEMILEIVDTEGRAISDYGYFTCDECGAEVDQYGGPGLRTGTSDAATSGGCFVVAAACGSESAYPVVVLRRFRDQRLSGCMMGRVAIWGYGRVGPAAAGVIRSNVTLRRWMYWVVLCAARFVDGRGGACTAVQGRKRGVAKGAGRR